MKRITIFIILISSTLFLTFNWLWMIKYVKGKSMHDGSFSSLHLDLPLQEVKSCESSIRHAIHICSEDKVGISQPNDVLFPYIKDNLENFIKDHWNEPLLNDDIEALRKQAECDVNQNLEGANIIPSLPATPSTENIDAVQKAVIANVLWQMSSDRKTTALKQLQGHMWATSYKNGDVKAHLYDDVPPALKKWKADGKLIYIYSSGSVEAQKLLFGHSTYGNLLEYLDGYFDTKIGAKVEASSYKKIASDIGQDPQHILFLTDVSKEAYAAQEAGMQTFLVVREGNAPLSDEDQKRFQQLTSFSQLSLE